MNVNCYITINIRNRMVSQDASWIQFFLGIIIGGITTFCVSLFTLWLIRNRFKPKIERVFEKNQKFVYIELMIRIDAFDNIFKIIYSNFEFSTGLLFRDLKQGDDIFDASQNSDILKFLNNSQKRRKELTDLEVEVAEVLNERHEFMDPEFQIMIQKYTQDTLNFIDLFFDDNLIDLSLFQERLDMAILIMDFLKNEKIYKNFHLTDHFTNRWKEYEKSEQKSQI